MLRGLCICGDYFFVVDMKDNSIKVDLCKELYLFRFFLFCFIYKCYCIIFFCYDDCNCYILL